MKPETIEQLNRILVRMRYNIEAGASPAVEYSRDNQLMLTRAYAKRGDELSNLATEIENLQMIINSNT